jgi:DNA-binding winged helix-turn-helix (wHTH) protein/Tol biopolymer transport system component
MSPQSKQFYEFANFHLDISEKVLLRDGEPVSLSPKAFDLLSLLTENAGHLLEKDELMQKIWHDRFVEEGNLAFNIKVLRKVLGDNASKPQFIETVPRRGYRFIAEVNKIFETAAPPPSPRIETARQPYILLAISIISLICLFGIAFVWFRGEPKKLGGQSSSTRLTTNGKVTVAAVSPDGHSIVFAQKEGIGESMWLKDIDSGNLTPILPPQEIEFVGLTIAPAGDYVYYSVFTNNSAVLTLSRISVQGGAPESLSEIATDVSISFSPDGKKFAFTESYVSLKETYLKTADADGTNQKKLVTTKSEKRAFPIFRASPVAWSPDGEIIACAVQETDENGAFYKILAVDPTDGSEKYLSGRSWDFVENVVWKDAENLALISSSPGSPFKQIWQINRRTGEARQLTDDLNDYQWLGAAHGNLYAVQKIPYTVLQIADFSADGKTSQTKQIYSESGAIENVEWSADDKIFYNSWTSGKNEIWQINADGTAPRRLTTNSNLTYGFAVSPDNRRFVFSALDKGANSLFAADSDGQNIRRLTSEGNDYNPRFMPDGKEVVFQRGLGRTTLWRVSLEKNQSPKQITGYPAAHPEVSPDGQIIAYQFMDFADGSRRWKLGLMNSSDGRLLNKIDFPLLITQRKTLWDTRRNRLTMIYKNAENTGLLFLSPTDGKYETIEDFAQGEISSFAWSPDSTRLAFSQTHETRDVVALTDL